MTNKDVADGLWRRQFLGGLGALALGGLSGAKLLAQRQPPIATGTVADLVLVNGKIHTMDPNNRVVSQLLIQNGRFAAVGNDIAVPRGNIRRIDLKGEKTVIPGIIDAHNHIVVVGNRPGWHTPLEHSFHPSWTRSRH